MITTKIEIAKLWKDSEARGELLKNVGLGIFVNAIYGISDNSIELYNIIDGVVSLYIMVLGIIIERRNKWDI